MPFDGLETPLNYLAKFDQAIGLIETPGNWTQHTYRTPRGQYCLKEVLNEVGIAGVFEPIILKTAAKMTEREFCCVESFNDWPQTTHGDVLAVLHQVRSDIVAGKVTLPAVRPPSERQGEPISPIGSRLATLWQRVFA